MVLACELCRSSWGRGVHPLHLLSLHRLMCTLSPLALTLTFQFPREGMITWRVEFFLSLNWAVFASSPDCCLLSVNSYQCLCGPLWHFLFGVCREERGVNWLGPSYSVSLPVFLLACLWTNTSQDGHTENKPTSPLTPCDRISWARARPASWPTSLAGALS